MITAPKNIVSIGRLAGMLDTTRDRVAKAAEHLRVSAIETIDEVPFFDSADIARIREYLNQSHAKLSEAKR